MADKNKSDNKTTSMSTLTKIDVVVESLKNKSKVEKTTQTQQSIDKSVQIAKAQEFGGRGGLEPTRFGDWEKNGRCIDF